MILDWNFEVWAVQKYANLVDRVKSFPTSIYLQKLASIQPRTSLWKFIYLVIIQPWDLIFTKAPRSFQQENSRLSSLLLSGEHFFVFLWKVTAL